MTIDTAAVAAAHDAMAQEYDSVDDLWYAHLFDKIHRFLIPCVPRGGARPAVRGEALGIVYQVIATLDRVRISRGEDEAIIEYADPQIRITHFRLGSVVATMTDQQILDRVNEHIEAVEQLRTE